MSTNLTSLEKIKKFGQVFTPPNIVNFMLDAVGYKGKTIIDKHVIDNSCGDGNFLVEMVNRYLEATKEIRTERVLR